MLERDLSKVDLEDRNGCTPLFYAIRQGHNEIVKMLLQNNANPNHRDQKGRLPAHCACALGNLECLKYLKEYGCEYWESNKKGDYPIHEAAFGSHLEIIKYVLDGNEEKINIGNSNGRTSLHIAALIGDTKLCKLLLDMNADKTETYGIPVKYLCFFILRKKKINNRIPCNFPIQFIRIFSKI